MLKIYPWQNNEWQRLMDMQQHKRLPHAILLSGPEGIGLSQFAQSFAMQMLCLSRINNEACGTCQSCQLFLAGNHPDFTMLEPEEEGKQIKIAQIRELIDYVSLKSFSFNRKIAIIQPADAMNRSTANALLKTLEEPPEQSMLILLSNRPARLPITIRSRCQTINFAGANDVTAIKWLSEQIKDSEVDAELLLKLSNGGPLKALELFESEKLPQRQAILKDLSSLHKKKFDVIQIAAQWQEYGCENVLACLLQLTQDLVRLKLLNDKANPCNVDMKQDLQELVKTLDLAELVRNYDFIQNKYQELTGPMNYNPLAILEQVIINWANPELTR